MPQPVRYKQLNLCLSPSFFSFLNSFLLLFFISTPKIMVPRLHLVIPDSHPLPVLPESLVARNVHPVTDLSRLRLRPALPLPHQKSGGRRLVFVPNSVQPMPQPVRYKRIKFVFITFFLKSFHPFSFYIYSQDHGPSSSSGNTGLP